MCKEEESEFKKESFARLQAIYSDTVGRLKEDNKNAHILLLAALGMLSMGSAFWIQGTFPVEESGWKSPMTFLVSFHVVLLSFAVIEATLALLPPKDLGFLLKREWLGKILFWPEKNEKNIPATRIFHDLLEDSGNSPFHTRGMLSIYKPIYKKDKNQQRRVSFESESLKSMKNLEQSFLVEWMKYTAFLATLIEMKKRPRKLALYFLFLGSLALIMASVSSTFL